MSGSGESNEDISQGRSDSARSTDTASHSSRVGSLRVSHHKKRGSLTLKSVTDTGHGEGSNDGINDDEMPESMSTRFFRALVIRKKPKWFHHNHYRGQLVRFLHSGFVGHTMNVLLVVDIVLLIVGIQMEVYYLESKIDDFAEACEHHAESLDHYGDHELHEQEKQLVATSIGILSVFLLEIFLSIIAEGMVFFHSPLHWLDMVVISVSLFFEVHGDHAAAEALILVRCWRFLRLIHGVFDILEDNSGDEEGAENENKEESEDGGGALEEGKGSLKEVSIDTVQASRSYLDSPEGEDEAQNEGEETVSDKIPHGSKA